MFEYQQLEKLRDKLILALIIFVVFGFLYTTTNKNDLNFDNEDIGNTMLLSLSIQIFRFDLFKMKRTAFVLSIMQAILSYVIIIM